MVFKNTKITVENLIKLKIAKFGLIIAVLFFNFGCGYSFRALRLDAKTIFIAPIKNNLSIADRYSNLNELQRYYPNLETKVREKLINRFLFDGQLKPVSTISNADLELEVVLRSFLKEPVSYDNSNNVIRWRISIGCDVKLKKSSPNTTVSSATVYGEYLYTANTESEDVAIDKAVDDLSKRIVDWIVAGW